MFVKTRLLKVVLQDNDLELWRQRPTRAARGGEVSGAGASAVRPQHVEVRVEKEQKIHDVRKTHIHEYSQPAETRGTVNDAVKASSPPWSTRHGPPKLYPSLGLKILTRASCEGCDVARRNRKHQGPRRSSHPRQGKRESEMPGRRRRKTS